MESINHSYGRETSWAHTLIGESKDNTGPQRASHMGNTSVADMQRLLKIIRKKGHAALATWPLSSGHLHFAHSTIHAKFYPGNIGRIPRSKECHRRSYLFRFSETL